MSILPDHTWKTKYTPDDSNLVQDFYLPALQCAVRYDRSTGYFSATALALAARGIEELVRNEGHMRLLVGCTLHEAEVQAIERGAELRETVQANLLRCPLASEEGAIRDALELLSWMVAQGILEVRVAVPCDSQRRPIPVEGIFHEKAGVIQDKAGNRLAFAGSINETENGWKHNWESFHVYTDWTGTKDHVEEEELSFGRLWSDKSPRARVLDIPAAVKDELLGFLPKSDLPARLKHPEPETPPEVPVVEVPAMVSDPRRLAWGFIRHCPSLPNGGERIGEATSAIEPWPHQIRTFQKVYDHWPPNLLIADEVGLGKTITAGILLRQAVLSGRAKRILILAPKAILRQWQVELREKFNLNWPIYDGHRLMRYPTRSLGPAASRDVSRADWHKEPFVLASSQLMRRAERVRELVEDAEGWDLLVLDEAHHARRKGAGSGKEGPPNQLLRLMQKLRQKAPGLLMLTATPMQVHPIEIWDLLSLLGLPPQWSASAFLDYFDLVTRPNPSNEELDRLAALFRSFEAVWGELEPAEVMQRVEGLTRIRAKKILGALRDKTSIPRHQLETHERASALRLLKTTTPVSQLFSRHTRSLLRRYRKAGKLQSNIADRQVTDQFVELTPAERQVYEAMEDYISSTYNNAAPDQRNAVGFVMTIYRRRLASSFKALEKTLHGRRGLLDGPAALRSSLTAEEEDLPDDEAGDELVDTDDVAAMERQALDLEERSTIDDLLRRVRKLGTDTKAKVLIQALGELKQAGYPQVMVFTQFTDTMDFLREELGKLPDLRLMCFSGRGGEILGHDGDWRTVSREEIKRLFREGAADVLLCTDAAAEGLNFQFCGALVNYDLPWNPMKVEQRIGRIDRLGQRFDKIRIVNLHYQDTVETDVYEALRHRIDLFQTFVGRLQPILARLPKGLAEATLGPAEEKERLRSNLVSGILREMDQPPPGGFDLDMVSAADLEIGQRPAPLYGMDELDQLLHRPELLLPGTIVHPLGYREYSYSQPGMKEPLRVTTSPSYFDDHPESTELWSPGSPLFPNPDVVAEVEEVQKAVAEGRGLGMLIAGRKEV